MIKLQYENSCGGELNKNCLMNKKNKKIKICDAIVHPGEAANLALPLPELYSFALQYMLIKV
jgi:hypothetical protein